MATQAEIAIMLTAVDRASAAMQQAQRAVAGIGGAATRTEAQQKRSFDRMARTNTDLHKGLATVNHRAETLFKTFESGSLGLNLVSLGLGGIGMAAVGLGMSFNSSMQQAQLAFGVLLKGPGEADAAIAALVATAKTLPFTLTPIIQAGQRLTSAGFADVPGLITTIADAVSATGNISNDTLQSVVSSFVQLKSSGTFSMGVISDLTQAGIPVVRALAQQMGMTEFATSKMLESMSGKVPSDFLIPKILAALKGMTGGLAAKEVNTLAGAITNLQDRFAIFMGGLTGGVTDVAQGAVSGLASMFDQLTTSMEGWNPTIKKTLGFALLLGSAVAGVGGLGGSIPGLGALGSLFGGQGGGMAGPILAVVITLIGLIALLTPWGAIFDAIKGVLDAIKDAIDRLPHGGGGGGGGPGFPSAPIPVVAEIVLKPGSREQLQRDVDAWGALSGKIGLVPTPQQDVQRQLDPWTLTKQLILGVPVVGDVQRVIDAWPRLQTALALVPPAWAALQDQIGRWPTFTHALELMIPAWGAIQSIVDAWPVLQKALGLNPTPQEVIQGEIDAWGVPTKALGLIPPAPEEIQGTVDLWPVLTKGLNLEIPDGGTMQTGIEAAYPSLVSGLNLRILPTQPDVQHLLDAVFPNLRLRVGVDVSPNPPDLGKLPGGEPDVPKVPGLPPLLPPGVGVVPLPGGGLGASGGQVGDVLYPPGALPKYAAGGVVPGAVGSPMLALVHGGEEITPAGSRGGGGLTVNVTVNGPMLGTDLEDVIVQQIDNARRRARLPVGA